MSDVSSLFFRHLDDIVSSVDYTELYSDILNKDSYSPIRLSEYLTASLYLRERAGERGGKDCGILANLINLIEDPDCAKHITKIKLLYIVYQLERVNGKKDSPTTNSGMYL